MNYETTGTIFNTQKFSIHDGNGLRTLIFMKGCPLNCLWCSNPESQNPKLEIMDVKSNCIGCGKCAILCESNAIHDSTFDIDRSLCVKCGKCAIKCYANAKKMVGKETTVREMMELIEKDRIFYTNSGGGVTVGGGEPLMQPEFVRDLLSSCRQSNIHTAIETCGYGKWDDIKEVFEATDQIFFDLKALDSNLHRELTGVENEIILENASRLVKSLRRDQEIVFRIPLVPGCNDSEENIEATGIFVSTLEGPNKNISIEILPYHNLGEDKYKWLNREYSLAQLKKHEKETVEHYKEILRKTCKKILIE